MSGRNYKAHQEELYRCQRWKHCVWVDACMPYVAVLKHDREWLIPRHHRHVIYHNPWPANPLTQFKVTSSGHICHGFTGRRDGGHYPAVPLTFAPHHTGYVIHTFSLSHFDINIIWYKGMSCCGFAFRYGTSHNPKPHVKHSWMYYLNCNFAYWRRLLEQWALCI